MVDAHIYSDRKSHCIWRLSSFGSSLMNENIGKSMKSDVIQQMGTEG